MKQTAIQQAIVMVRSRIDSIDETLMGKHTIHHLQQIERGLYDLLGEEKEQIIQTEKEMYNKLMANKTAMYKLKTHLDNEVKLGFLDTKYNERIQWYIDTYFIEAEKEQIIDAAKSCNYIGGATNIEAEKYYNQKYNQNK